MGKAFKEAFLALFSGVTLGFVAFGALMSALRNLAVTADEMTIDLPIEAKDDRLYESAVRRASHAAKLAALEAPVTPAAE